MIDFKWTIELDCFNDDKNSKERDFEAYKMSSVNIYFLIHVVSKKD